jgi:DNA-directed RNA polymerase specialized sigma24 family protein
MTSRGSVTLWIEQLKAGEEAALAKLHKRYWPELVRLAQRRLRGLPCRASDEEDVAEAALWSFYRGLREGRLPRLTNRNDLLALLTHLIACKAANQIKHEVGLQKRNAGRTQSDSSLDRLAEAPGPTPLEQALLNDCYERYVTALPDMLREIAELHLSGCTHKEIAGQVGCVVRTVERKLAIISEKWQKIALASVGSEG